MNDPMLLNGKPRCTLIQSFNGLVIVIGPGGKFRKEWGTIEEANEMIEKRGWVISIVHPSLRKET